MMADLNSTDISLPIASTENKNPSNNYKPKNYVPSFGLRYKILEFFRNSQPFLVGVLCLCMAILIPLVISNLKRQNQLNSHLKTTYEKTQSRLKSVENRALKPGPRGYSGPKGELGSRGPSGRPGEKGKPF